MNYLNIKTNENTEYTVKESILMSEKVSFIKYVAEMVVSDELGYLPMLKDLFFDYAILQYYTDIVVFENEEGFSIDVLEQFIKANKDIILAIKNEVGIDEVNFLKTCCNELIEFRRVHYGEYKNDIAELLDTVRELVVKPDYMSELLKAVTEWVNTSAGKEIDLDIVTKLAEIVPMMKDMGSVEVAKAIIDNKDNIISMVRESE